MQCITHTVAGCCLSTKTFEWSLLCFNFQFYFFRDAKRRQLLRQWSYRDIFTISVYCVHSGSSQNLRFMYYDVGFFTRLPRFLSGKKLSNTGTCARKIPFAVSDIDWNMKQMKWFKCRQSADNCCFPHCFWQLLLIMRIIAAFISILFQFLHVVRPTVTSMVCFCVLVSPIIRLLDRVFPK